MSPLRERYIDPLTDYGFKRLFGTEPNKDILISFLNELLPKRHQIDTLTFGNNEKVGNTPVDRKAIFDLYCISGTGERFVVELQKAKQRYFKDRSLYYATFPIQEQSEKGIDWHFRLDAVYTIGILDFLFDEEENTNDDFYHLVELKDQHNSIFLDKLKFIYVELPKFTKSFSELNGDLDRWLYVLRHMADLEEPPTNLTEGIFGKLFSEAQIANFSTDELSAYRSSVKHTRDLRASMWTAKQEGHQEGRIEGIEEGEERKALAVARELRKQGIDDNVIMVSTGLSMQQLKNLN